jgi:hypothetical protein
MSEWRNALWASTLRKPVGRARQNMLHARQISNRGGDIRCELMDNRDALAGYAITFMEAEIWLPFRFQARSLNV